MKETVYPLDDLCGQNELLPPLKKCPRESHPGNNEYQKDPEIC